MKAAAEIETQFKQITNLLIRPRISRYNPFVRFYTFIHLKNLEIHFYDFYPNIFPDQARQLYEETLDIIHSKKYNKLSKYISYPLYSATVDTDGSAKFTLEKALPKKVSNFKIEYATTINQGSLVSEIEALTAQVTVSFDDDLGKRRFAVLERNLGMRFSFYDWTFIDLDYSNI